MGIHTYIYILQNLGLKKAMGRLSIPLMAVGVLLFALAYCATPSLAEDSIGELDGGLLVELKTLNRELRSAETKKSKRGPKKNKDKNPGRKRKNKANKNKKKNGKAKQRRTKKNKNKNTKRKNAKKGNKKRQPNQRKQKKKKNNGRKAAKKANKNKSKKKQR